MAPEALSGALVDEAADIYSLATITYFLLTARHPHTGRSPRELFQQLLTQPPTPLNQAVKGVRFPQALEDAVMRGLSREPSERQADVMAFAEEFRAATLGTPAAAEPSDETGGLLGTLRAIVRGRRREPDG